MNVIEKIISYFIISLFISSFAFGSDKIKGSNNSSQAFFIIDYDVNLYKDKDSTDIQKKITFFDSITVLSDDVSINGRIKVKMKDGTEGWIEEKYTSYIPKNWKKLVLLDDYYCYVLTDKKLNIKKDEMKQYKMYYYLNNDIDIAMGVVFLKNYQQEFNSKLNIINMKIEDGYDKKSNFSKEFILGNYKVNYVITTGYEEGRIEELFDFAKLDELNLKKYYNVAIDYQPYESKKKKLLWRKILFSTLQSLK